MPNHVTTRCVVVGPKPAIKQFRDRAFRIEDNATVFDFNAFIPMPPVVAGTQSGTIAEQGAALVSLIQGRAPPRAHSAVALGLAEPELRPATIKQMRETLDLREAPLAELANAWLEKNPEYRTEGDKRLRALAETGFPDWYEWACQNWNTKWNAYNSHIIRKSPLEFTFNTAWDFPMLVFEKIAQEFPALSFRCTCYDEGDNFAGDGFFNPQSDQAQFAICDATDELYERVYGHPPGVDEDD